MPIVDNQKMACAPCIKGHRSTKCTHQGERQLHVVRRPGRPLSQSSQLSTDPHFKCDCTKHSVLVAIPRNSSCPHSKTLQTRPLIQPTRPDATKASFKVGKSATARPPSRKGDYVKAEQLESILHQATPKPLIAGIPPWAQHAQSFIASEYDGLIGSPIQSNGVVNLPQNERLFASSIRVNQNGEISNGFILPPQMQPQQFTSPNHSNQSGGILNGGHMSEASPMNYNGIADSLIPQTPRSETAMSYYNPPKQEPFGSNHSSGNYSILTGGFGSHDSNETMVYKQSSFMELDSSTQSSTQSPDTTDVTTMASSLSPTNAIVDTLYKTQQHTFQPQHTTDLQYMVGKPVSQTEDQQLPNQRDNMFSKKPPQPSQFDGAPSQSATSGYVDQDSNDSCCCGNDCACIGCPTHPYNDAMTSWVRENYSVPEYHRQSCEQKTNGAESHEDTNGVDRKGPNTITSSSHAGFDGINVQEHIDESSPSNIFGDDSYVVAKYDWPEDDGCGGSEDACLCGPECSCLGCIMHGNTQQPDTPLLFSDYINNSTLDAPQVDHIDTGVSSSGGVDPTLVHSFNFSKSLDSHDSSDGNIPKKMLCCS